MCRYSYKNCCCCIDRCKSSLRCCSSCTISCFSWSEFKGLKSRSSRIKTIRESLLTPDPSPYKYLHLPFMIHDNAHQFLDPTNTRKNLSLFELANQNERSPVLPVMQNGHPLTIGCRLASPTHPWAGYLNTITPMMHPVMSSSDRIRAGVWSSKSTPSTPVGNLHMKGNLEVNLVIICTEFQFNR